MDVADTKGLRHHMKKDVQSGSECVVVRTQKWISVIFSKPTFRRVGHLFFSTEREQSSGASPRCIFTMWEDLMISWVQLKCSELHSFGLIWSCEVAERYFDHVQQSSDSKGSINSTSTLLAVNIVGLRFPLFSSKCFWKKEQGWVTHHTWFCFVCPSLRFVGLVQLAPSYAFVCCPGYKLVWHTTSLNATFWRLFCQGFCHRGFWLNYSAVSLFVGLCDPVCLSFGELGLGGLDGLDGLPSWQCFSPLGFRHVHCEQIDREITAWWYRAV